MEIFLIIVGIILIIVGIVGFFKVKASQDRLAQLGASSKQKLGELVPILMQTKADMSDLGDENIISENATVMGQPQCQTPLRSPIAGIPCVYYKYKVVYKTTERYQETDSEGNTEWKTRTHEQTLDQGTNSTVFAINDGTGSIMVDPKDGTFEGLTKTVDKTETNFQRNGNGVQLGNLMVSLANLGTAVANAVATSNMNNGMMNNMNGMNNMSAMNNGMMNNMNGMNNMNNGMMSNMNGMNNMNNGMMNNMNGMNNGMMNNMNAMNNGMMNNMNNGMMNNMNAMNNGMMNNMNAMNNGMNNMNNNNMSVG